MLLFLANLRKLHWVILGLVCCSFIIRSFFNFNTYFDFLYYHLPFALMMHGITTYEPPSFLIELYLGFPPLAHWFQGLLVRVSNSISWANSINVWAVAFFLLSMRHLYGERLNVRWLLTGLISIPLVSLHIFSGYIDLWLGCFLAVAVCSLFYIQSYDAHAKPIFYFLIGVGVSAFSKIQAWPIVAILSMAFFFVILHQRWPIKKAAVVLTVLIMVSSFWPIRNILKFDNPTYPYTPPIVGKYFSQNLNPIFDLKRNQSQELPLKFKDISKPFLYFISAFELNRVIGFQTPFKWQHDGWMRGESQNIHYRMGGWFLAPYVILLWIFLSTLSRKPKNVKSTHILWLVLFLATSIIPQSHELRYFLFLPISGIVLIVTEMNGQLKNKYNLNVIAKSLFMLGFLIVLFKTDPFSLDFRTPEEKAPKQAVLYWQNPGSAANCLKVKLSELASAIYWAGPQFNTYPVKTCLE